LLITRVFDGAGDADETVNFGYVGGAPETDDLSGNTPGVRSSNPDLVVKVWVKGDCSGDGKATTADVVPFYNVYQGTATPDGCYRADFNVDGQVTSADTVPFYNNISWFSGCTAH
jgi:hypothetical protein